MPRSKQEASYHPRKPEFFVIDVMSGKGMYYPPEHAHNAGRLWRTNDYDPTSFETRQQAELAVEATMFAVTQERLTMVFGREAANKIDPMEQRESYLVLSEEEMLLRQRQKKGRRST